MEGWEASGEVGNLLVEEVDAMTELSCYNGPCPTKHGRIAMVGTCDSANDAKINDSLKSIARGKARCMADAIREAKRRLDELKESAVPAVQRTSRNARCGYGRTRNEPDADTAAEKVRSE